MYIAIQSKWYLCWLLYICFLMWLLTLRVSALLLPHCLPAYSAYSELRAVSSPPTHSDWLSSTETPVKQ